MQLFRPGALGDIIMSTSVFAGLKAKGYRIRYICHPFAEDLLANHPDVDELITTLSSNWDDLPEITAHLEPADLSVVLNYPDELQPVRPHPYTMHLTAFLCMMVGVAPTDELSLHLLPEHEQWAERYSNAVLLHASTGWSYYKDWPIDRWAELADRIQSQWPVEVYQVGAPSDKRIPNVPLLESPGLLYSIAALKACRLFIGLDSMLNHASRAVKKPSLIIWGSSHPASVGYAQNINLVNGVAWRPEMGNYGPTMHCQPCYKSKNLVPHAQPPCPNLVPYHQQVLPTEIHPDPVLHACMASNTVDIVYFHACRMLYYALSQQEGGGL